MACLAADNVQQVKPEVAARFRLGPVFGWSVLAAIFLTEFISGIFQWRADNSDGAVAVAMFSLAFLAMIWSVVILSAEGFSRLLCRLRYSGRTWSFHGLKAMGALTAAGIWAFVMFDLEVHYAMGFYLDPSLLEFTVANMQAGLWAHLATKHRWLLGLGLGFLVTTSPMVFIYVWRNATRLRLMGNPRLRRPVLGLVLVVTVLFTLSTVLMNRDDFKGLRTRIVRHLSYQLEPTVAFAFGCADVYHDLYDDSHLLDESILTPISAAPVKLPALSDKPNIIFLQVESFRADIIDMLHQGIEVTPNMNALARKSTRFRRAYAPGTHTSLSNVSIPTSNYPLRHAILRPYKRDDPAPRKMIYDLLKPEGYATAWYSSDFESWMGMCDYIETPALDTMVDATVMQVRDHPERIGADHWMFITLEPDQETLSYAMDWMDGEIKKKHPFYMTLRLSDSHFPYDSSVKSNVFQPTGIPAGCTIFDYPPSAANQIRNTYLNAIHGIDILFGQLMTFLRHRGADEHTIIVIYGDHGESFGEHHILSHGSLPYDVVSRTPLIMYGKGYFQPGVEDYPTSLIDIVPTVLTKLGEPRCPNFQGIDVLSPSRPPLARRCIYIHCDGQRNGDGLVAAGRWKYFIDNGLGACYLYDLATDPGETNNLLNAQPGIAEALSQQLTLFCTDQLTYYRSAHYNKRFYPPPPPQLVSMDAVSH